MKNIKILLGLLVSVAALPAHATYVFSDVSYTANSVTFTINGNMTGYSAPALHSDQFSLQYFGDIWTGKTTYTANTWSSNVFNNESPYFGGYTGGYETCCSIYQDYSWIWFYTPLSDSYATSNTVTVNLGDNYLNTGATSGSIDFLWGNVSVGGPTIVGSWNVPSSVPEPASLALLGLGLAGIGFGRRKKA